MSAVKPIETLLNVSRKRRHWTNVNSFYKKYFTEKIIPIFNDSLTIDDCSIPILIDDHEESSIQFKDMINLTSYLIGGYVYEYIYNLDVESENSYISPTSDVDIPVKIPDLFSDESNVVDVKRLGESDFFINVINQIIEKLTSLDYSELENLNPLNDLPEVEDEFTYYDKNKVRFLIGETMIEESSISKKIQIMICKDDIYEEIVDLMIVFSVGMKDFKIEEKSKEFYNDSIGIIKYASKKELLSSDVDALLSRYNYPELISKTRNHLGRVLYLLTLIDVNGNDDDKFAAKSTCEYLFTRLHRLFKINFKEISKIVICSYKNEIFTFGDMISPIKNYALQKRSQIFIQVFGVPK